MANKRRYTAQDVLDADERGSLEADENYYREQEYGRALADFDHFVHCLDSGAPLDRVLAKSYATKLKRIRITQHSAQLGSDLVSAFNLNKPGAHDNNFLRDTTIAYRRIVLKESRQALAESYDLTPEHISRIVKKYRDYTEANERYFPAENPDNKKT